MIANLGKGVGPAYHPPAFKSPALPTGFAMRQPPEIIRVHEHRVACDGGGGALGHPRVFLEMGPDHKATCPYCGREFHLCDHEDHAH